MHVILEPTQAVQACRDTNVECPGANARVPLRLRDTDLTFRNKPA